MAAMAVGLFLLSLIGRPGRHSRSWDLGAAVVGSPPRACTIVPVSGSGPRIEACLESVLSQDYPDYEVLFVTRSPDEEAAALVRRVLEKRPAGSSPVCRHIVAGPASSCGQKNHNLLAGIRAAARDREVFVFLDAARPAPPFWLKSLTGPIARGEAAVTTGYHHVLPGDGGIAATGHAVVVLFLNCIQETGWLTQPWGGNTAISRKAFEDLEVGAIWERNVVDDVSLGAILARVGQKAKYVGEAQLAVPIEGETLKSWCRWLTRQVLYLKFCLPGTWIPAGFLILLCATLILVAGVRITAGSTGVLPAGTILPDILFLSLLTITAWTMRASHPRPGPPFKWLAASFAAVFVSAFCAVRTFFTDEILWRGIRYKVSTGGRVTGLSDERGKEGTAGTT